MSTLLSAVARALRDLAQGRILAVLFLPMFGAVLVWLALAFIFWAPWTEGLANFLDGTWLGSFLARYGWGWLTDSVGAALVVVLLIPATLITAALITELFAMPVIVNVAGASYPGLERRRGGSVAGSLLNAVGGITRFTLLWLVTLPLWLTGIGAIILPAINAAYLNQRLFRYDALAEHASPEEIRQVIVRNKGRLFGLGLIVAPLYYVPLVNLAAPVIAGLTFTHFCLAELRRVRI